MRCPTPNKKRYRSAMDAGFVLNKLKSKEHGEQRVYWCRCKAWHLTSSTKVKVA